jgi:hypothetical protein
MGDVSPFPSIREAISSCGLCGDEKSSADKVRRTPLSKQRNKHIQRGLEWPDYKGEALAVNRSVWKGVVNRPKTRTSQQPVPVIPKLAKLLDEYRASMGNPTTGAMFHNGSGEIMDMDKLPSA